jgi:cbb3-type cytochrome oxidase maturation protein
MNMSTILLILAGVGFLIGGSLTLYWAVSTGQFKDPEAIKYRMLKD